MLFSLDTVCQLAVRDKNCRSINVLQVCASPSPLEVNHCLTEQLSRLQTPLIYFMQALCSCVVTMAMRKHKQNK